MRHKPPFSFIDGRLEQQHNGINKEQHGQQYQHHLPVGRVERYYCKESREEQHSAHIGDGHCPKQDGPLDIEGLADTVKDNEPGDASQQAGHGGQFADAEIQYIPDNHNHDNIHHDGQRTRQSLSEYSLQKIAGEPVFIGLKGQEEGRDPYGYCADKGELDGNKRISLTGHNHNDGQQEGVNGLNQEQ